MYYLKKVNPIKILFKKGQPHKKFSTYRKRKDGVARNFEKI